MRLLSSNPAARSHCEVPSTRCPVDGYAVQVRVEVRVPYTPAGGYLRAVAITPA